jgi:hypothetical protein
MLNCLAMEEIEVPTEHLQEEIHHHAHGSGESWLMQVALTSALLAVLAALAALLSGHDANESMMLQIQSSDKWSHYQAKSIKGAVQRSQAEMLVALGKNPSEKTTQELERYENEKDQLSEEAKEAAEKSEHHLARHERFSVAVTFFQVAIGVAAISVLTKRRRFFHVSLLFGLAGLVMLVIGGLVHI